MISRLLNTLSLLVSCLFLASCRQSAVGADDAARMKERYENASWEEQKWLSYKTAPSTIIYGTVVDTEGNPIAKADVLVSWFELIFPLSTKARNEKVVSDAEGNFQYDCRKPNGRISADAKKTGYASIQDATVYTGNQKTSKDAPVFIVLRKIGQTSFLLNSPKGELSWFESRDKKEVNLPFDVFARLEKFRAPNVAAAGTFVLDGVQNSAQDGWTLTFSATNKTIGMIWSDKLLYQAPEREYVPSVSFTASINKVEKKYLYLKCRDPDIYMRICFQYGSGSSPAVFFAYSFTINPYGERTFEYDERFDQFWREKKKWVEDAKTALREGRYPEKIDIDAFIKAKEQEKAGGLKP